MRHAWVLKRLANTLPPTEIGGLSETTHHGVSLHGCSPCAGSGRTLREAALGTCSHLLSERGFSGAAGRWKHFRPRGSDRCASAVVRGSITQRRGIQSSFSVTTGQAAEGTAKVQEIQNSLLQVESLSSGCIWRQRQRLRSESPQK